MATIEEPGVDIEVNGKSFHLGYSRISSFQTCPKKYFYEYEYGERVRAPANVAMRKGTAYHNTLDNLLQYKIDNDFDLMDRDAADKLVVKYGLAEKLSKSAIHQTIDAMRYYHEHQYPRHLPLAVEREFEIVRAGVKITGRIDLFETTGVITDHKFSNDIWAAGRAQYGVQPVIYDWAGRDVFAKEFHVPYSGFHYNIVRLWPNPVMQIIKIKPVTQAQSDFWERQIEQIARAMTEGIFPANPSEDNCKWCDHKVICDPCIYDIEIEQIGTRSKFEED